MNLSLGPSERRQLIDSAPPENGDHLVALQRAGAGQVFGIVRRDALGCRLVAIGGSAQDVRRKLSPASPRPEHVPAGQAWGYAESSQRGARKGGRRGGEVASERRQAAERSFRDELAGYRRAVAASGGSDATELLG